MAELNAPSPRESARSRRAGVLVLAAALAVATTGIALAQTADTVSFRPGTLPRQWDVAGPNCAEVPDFQVVEYNPDLFILRQSGCTHDEKPFLYLLFGDDEALLLDTGAGNAESLTTRHVDVVGAVDTVIAEWLKENGRESIPLVVSHLHSHGDHTAGDPDFAARPDTTLIAPTTEATNEFFGITDWPEGMAEYDLGDRIIDVIAIPGHDVNSYAFYDKETGILFTGDSLYPGRVYVNGDPAVFIASNQRLVDFAAEHYVTWILGTHIEQTRTPFVDYPVGTAYAPDEAPLEMTVGQLIELNEYLKSLNGVYAPHRFAGFSVCNGYPNCDAQTVITTP